jgi:hypothetical protein
MKVDNSRFLPEIMTRFKAVLLHYSLSNLNLNGVFQNWEKLTVTVYIGLGLFKIITQP